MDNVPNIISTKDLSYICDMFNWNFIASKKAYNYISQTNDKDISKELNSIYKMHKNICNELLNILNQEGANE